MSEHHAALGLNAAATEAEIKAAYRRLAKEHHPDRNPGDADAVTRFHAITAAYEALTRPQHQQQFGGFDFFGGGDHRQMFEQMMRRMQEQELRNQNHDIQTAVEITLQQAFTGCDITVPVNLPGRATSHKVSIPRGIADGQRIRVTGAGVQRNTNYPPGDLYVVIRVALHDGWSRIGDDLVCQVTIDGLAAILGTTHDLADLFEKPIRCEFRSGVQFGERIRLPGLGMPHLNSDTRGDAVVEVIIRTPELSEIDRKMVDEIANKLPTANSDL